MWRCEYYATLTLWRISCECKTFIFAAYSPEMIRLPRRITEKVRPFEWLRMLPNFLRIPANFLRSLRSVCRISWESFANVKTTYECLKPGVHTNDFATIHGRPARIHTAPAESTVDSTYCLPQALCEYARGDRESWRNR